MPTFHRLGCDYWLTRKLSNVSFLSSFRCLSHRRPPSPSDRERGGKSSLGALQHCRDEATTRSVSRWDRWKWLNLSVAGALCIQGGGDGERWARFMAWVIDALVLRMQGGEDEFAFFYLAFLCSLLVSCPRHCNSICEITTCMKASSVSEGRSFNLQNETRKIFDFVLISFVFAYFSRQRSSHRDIDISKHMFGAGAGGFFTPLRSSNSCGDEVKTIFVSLCSKNCYWASVLIGWLDSFVEWEWSAGLQRDGSFVTWDFDVSEEIFDCQSITCCVLEGKHWRLKAFETSLWT